MSEDSHDDFYIIPLWESNGKYYDSFNYEIRVTDIQTHIKHRSKYRRNFNHYRVYSMKYIKFKELTDDIAIVKGFPIFDTRPKYMHIDSTKRILFDKIDVKMIITKNQFLNLPLDDPILKGVEFNKCKVIKMLFGKDINYSELLQAVKIEGRVIKNIKNPGKEIEFLAVRTTPDVIENIEEASQDLQLIALTGDPKSFLKMKSPTYETMLMALALDGSLIDFIDDPPELFKRIAGTNVKD